MIRAWRADGPHLPEGVRPPQEMFVVYLDMMTPSDPEPEPLRWSMIVLGITLGALAATAVMWLLRWSH